MRPDFSCASVNVGNVGSLTSPSQSTIRSRGLGFAAVSLVSFCSLRLALIVILSAVAVVMTKPAVLLDPTDTCIFTCDYCYKGDLLLKCANECLNTEGDMIRVWHKTCPYFEPSVSHDK